jgi:hypothetical protein
MTPEQYRFFDVLCHVQGLPLEDQLWLLTYAAEAPRPVSDVVSLSRPVGGTGTLSDPEKRAA